MITQGTGHVATWGVVSTIKAPAATILRFAAHHLDLGAHRVLIYLDEDCPEARAALAANPRCRVILTDATYWGRRKRPGAHQPRQTANASHAYRRGPGVDWLAHIDVDEFLWPETDIVKQLEALPGEALTARIRPIEALAPDGDDEGPATWFKRCAARARLRAEQTAEIYPTFGVFLNGGFLSHVSGKIFVRCGQDRINLRIHNAFHDGVQIPNHHDLSGTLLCHLHAPSWDDWQRQYRYRLAQGSYRPEMKVNGAQGLNMNALFSAIEAEGGETTLRQFYNEVCTATPDLRAGLAAHGLLHRIDLDLDAKCARHFPKRS